MQYNYYTWYYTPETKIQYANFIYLTNFKIANNFLGLEVISDEEIKNIKYNVKPRNDHNFTDLKDYNLVTDKDQLNRLNQIVLNNAYKLIHIVFTE